MNNSPILCKNSPFGVLLLNTTIQTYLASIQDDERLEGAITYNILVYMKIQRQLRIKQHPIEL